MTMRQEERKWRLSKDGVETTVTPHGVDYDPADLLRTIEMWRGKTPPHQRSEEIASALTALCDSAHAAGQRVFLAEF